MKVHLILSGIILGALVGVGTASAENVGGGVKIGANFATISGDIDSGVTKSMLVGAIGGGFLTMGITDMVAFQPEVLYSQEGVKLKFTQGSTSIESKAKVGVVHVPLLIRVGRMAKSGTNGYFIVGPDIGFITSAKQETLGVTDDFKDDLKSWDASIVFGAGATMSHLLVEVRYAAGLSDINKNKQSSGTNKSNVFSVLVGGSF